MFEGVLCKDVDLFDLREQSARRQPRVEDQSSRTTIDEVNVTTGTETDVDDITLPEADDEGSWTLGVLLVLQFLDHSVQTVSLATFDDHSRCVVEILSDDDGHWLLLKGDVEVRHDLHKFWTLETGTGSQKEKPVWQ